MFKKAKDLEPGDVVIDQGRQFTVRHIQTQQGTGEIGILDTNDGWHGWYHPDEWLPIVEQMSAATCTR
jgi:hypothetical protein